MAEEPVVTEVTPEVVENRAPSAIAEDLWTAIQTIEDLIAELPEVAPTHGTALNTQKIMAKNGLHNVQSLAALATSG